MEISEIDKFEIDNKQKADVKTQKLPKLETKAPKTAEKNSTKPVETTTKKLEVEKKPTKAIEITSASATKKEIILNKNNLDRK